MPTEPRATVILFKPSGKYYTEESWRIPPGAIGPYDMVRSPDFRRFNGGAVLVPEQEPWGYPHVFPSEVPEVPEAPGPDPRVREVPWQVAVQALLNTALLNPDRLTPDAAELIVHDAETINAEYDRWNAGKTRALAQHISTELRSQVARTVDVEDLVAAIEGRP